MSLIREILEEVEEGGGENIVIEFTAEEANYLLKKMMRIPIHMEENEQFEMWFAILKKFGLENVIENLKTIFFNQD